MKGTRKGRRPRKRGRDEVEKDLNIMGVKYRKPKVRNLW
jgi:hypothetical protein